jgi:glycosyltransferase involved in cell wall biosynthesis
MHRIRLSLPWFDKIGIEYTVVAVQPQFIEASTDPVFEEHISFENIIRIKAFKPGLTRKFGLGNLGYRSMLQYNKTVTGLLKKEKYDLIYFSTTVFPILALGPRWKRKFGIPFIVDMQDPWRNDFYLSKPKNERPPKFFIAHRLNSWLERHTMKKLDGMISVSEAYPKTINRRYELKIPSVVIPFSASESDFNLVRIISLKNKVYHREKDTLYAVYTGAVTPGMPIPLKILLHAFGKCSIADGMKKIKLIFVGTTYGKGVGDKYRVLPLVQESAIRDMISEYPERVGYFDAIQVLLDSDMIIFPGSLDEGYTASKIFPYILSGKPIFALSHAKSSVAPIIEGCNAGTVVRFENREDLESKENLVHKSLHEFLNHLPEKTELNYDFFDQFSESAMVKKQVDFFESVLKG